jgi:lysozyme
MKKLFIFLTVLLVLILIGFHFADLNPTITSTSSFEIKGIDISHHNHHNSNINWNSVSNQVGFCIIKATQGSNFKDPMFNSNWKSTKKNNLVRGAYHYFSPGVSGKKQFDNFKNTVKLGSGDLPPILDVELKECDINEVKIFLELAEKYYGVIPIIFTEHLFFKVYLDGVIDTKYPLWIDIDASYFLKPSFNNYNCVLWQYSHIGNISGIKGDVDLDCFMGDSLSFETLKIK